MIASYIPIQEKNQLEIIKNQSMFIDYLLNIIKIQFFRVFYTSSFDMLVHKKTRYKPNAPFRLFRVPLHFFLNRVL